MSGKQKRQKPKAKRAGIRAENERLRLEKLANEGRLANGCEIPRDAVAADLSQQAPNNSYASPLYYENIEFTCVDCGSQQVWLAKDRKWYYEVAKGPIYAGPKRCRPCRKRFRESKAEGRAKDDSANRKRQRHKDDAL